jgi:hypothetical protein
MTGTMHAAALRPTRPVPRQSPLSQPVIATVHERFTATELPTVMILVKVALVALIVMALGPLSVSPADAEPRTRCLTRDQQRAAIAERRAVPLATVRKSVRSRVPGEMVRARLCQEPDRLIYLLTVLPRDGKVRRVIVDAKNGAVVSVR